MKRKAGAVLEQGVDRIDVAAVDDECCMPGEGNTVANVDGRDGGVPQDEPCKMAFQYWISGLGFAEIGRVTIPKGHALVLRNVHDGDIERYAFGAHVGADHDVGIADGFHVQPNPSHKAHT